jgi:hypothetical protein
MKTLINSTDFSDCPHTDFNHYFGSTAMMWEFSQNKKRIFVPSGVTIHGNVHVVAGSYLTKLKEWKEKMIPFKGWAKILHPIVIRDIWFRCGEGVCFSAPNLQRNLKKSPRWNYQGVSYLGEPDAADRSAQGMTYWAFHDIYEPDTPALRSLWKLLKNPEDGRRADVDPNGFAVCYGSKAKTWPVHFRRFGPIGKYDNGNETLVLTAGAGTVWADYLKSVLGLSEHGIRVAVQGA